jgi:peptidoglycan-associated lipoprotein
MTRTTTRVLLTSASILALVFVGCAKRPALTQLSAPSPSGASSAGATESSTTVATAPAAPAPAPAVTPPAPAHEPAAAPAARPAPKEFEAVAELKPIHFDFDKSDIRPGDAAILDGNARWLSANGKQLVLIEGHCDERGTNEYNMALGERRARAAMTYLMSRGIQQSRISTISYGEERPLCTAHDESCWSQNRRAQSLAKSGE